VSGAAVHITGKVARVIHYVKDTGFCVLSVVVPGLADRIKVVGVLAAGTLGEGYDIECVGVFEPGHARGEQYTSKSIQATPPATPPTQNPEPKAAIPSVGTKPGANDESAASVTIIGKVVRVLHHKPDTGFCVLLVAAKGLGDEVKVAGPLAVGSIAPGDEIECVATLVFNKFGESYKTDMVLTTPPRTTDGIERYLASGIVKGIGPALAKRLVDAFGAEVVEIIDQNPERLQEIPGLGPTRIEALREAWAEQRGVRDILIFLRSFGLGAAMAAKVHKAYGEHAITKIQDDPYSLARDIIGIGFVKADEVARSLGMPLDSPKRARAGVVYVMQERSMQGHCAATRDGLMAEAGTLLGGLDRAILERAITECLTSGELVLNEENEWLYLAALYYAEIKVAEGMARLLATSRIPWGKVDPKWAIRWAEENTGITLAASQRQALLTAIASKVVVITGGPGTGKTTILNGILGIVQVNEARVTLCAPTGRAAKRLAEATGLEAKTIHRTLEFDPIEWDFRRNAEFPLETDLVVVDEASMVDVSLMAKLLAAIPDHAALMIVGDKDQLPSVGPGSVLGDLIEADVVSVVRLTEIFRQEEGSLIVKGAHRINHGHMPESGKDGDPGADFFIVTSATPEGVAEIVVDLVTNRIPARYGLDARKDVQVLTPMHKGPVGTRVLNGTLRGLLNPNGQPRITRFGSEFAVGDKVFQNANNYKKEVYNGDIGVIRAIDLEAGNVIVEFDGRMVDYATNDLDSLALAYATTIHKSQGSEYPAVVIPLVNEQFIMLERSLLYTAVTRGKRLVVIVCQDNALRKAVRTHQSRGRLTGLTERLVQAVS